MELKAILKEKMKTEDNGKNPVADFWQKLPEKFFGDFGRKLLWQ